MNPYWTNGRVDIRTRQVLWPVRTAAKQCRNDWHHKVYNQLVGHFISS